jgi:hypothetical protein
MKLLVERFCGQGEEQDQRFETLYEKSADRMAVIRIQIERITGKARRAPTA